MAKINIPCIPVDVVEQIKKENLNVTSKERAEILKKYLTPEDSRNFNKLFEHSKTLKNKEKAYEKLLNEVIPDTTGTKAAKKKKLLDNIRFETQRKRELLYNSDGSVNENFETLVSRSDSEWKANTKKIFDTKHGIDIPEEKLEELTNLRRELGNLVEGTEEYGYAKIKLASAIDDIKNPTNKLGFLDSIKYGAKNVGREWDATSGFFPKTGVAVRAFTDVVFSEAYRAVKASVDLSMGLNQGYKVLLDNPKNWLSSMGDALKSLKGFGKQEVMDSFHIKLASDIDFNTALGANLKIGGLEEYFKDTLFSKIPGLGTAIKMSDNAFTIFTQTARFNIFKQQLKLLRKTAALTGEEVSEKALKDIAEFANSATGSGSFGKWEKVTGSLNKLLFAPKYMKSNIDTLTMPIRLREFNKVARIRSAKLLTKNIGVLAIGIGAATMFGEDRVTLDPGSPKFGKIRVTDDRWIPIGGQLPAYLTLLWRTIGGVTTNADGKTSELNTDEYGSKTRGDVLWAFARNKAAPIPSVIISAWLTGKDYKGEKYNPKDIPDSLLTPITMGNLFEMAQTDPDTLEAIMLGVGELGGLSSTNYSNSQKDTKAPIRSLIDIISGK